MSTTAFCPRFHDGGVLVGEVMMKRIIWRICGGHRLPDGVAERTCIPWTPWRCRYCRSDA